jgi:hypothetical protein
LFLVFLLTESLCKNQRKLNVLDLFTRTISEPMLHPPLLFISSPCCLQRRRLTRIASCLTDTQVLHPARSPIDSGRRTASCSSSSAWSSPVSAAHLALVFSPDLLESGLSQSGRSWRALFRSPRTRTGRWSRTTGCCSSSRLSAWSPLLCTKSSTWTLRASKCCSRRCC